MIPLPSWVQPEAWAEFVAARKYIKKPLTQGAAERQLKRLYAIKDAGHDANEALRYSADHYYQDVYPSKELELERKASSQAESTRAELDARSARQPTAPPADIREFARKAVRAA